SQHLPADGDLGRVEIGVRNGYQDGGHESQHATGEHQRTARRCRPHQPRPAVRTSHKARPGRLPRGGRRLDAPGLVGRPLTVLRVLRTRAPFMQKNVPKYIPDRVQTVGIWAEGPKREVRYAICDNRRTLLWFANQHAIEYHPTRCLAESVYRPTYFILDLDPPDDDDFSAVVAVAHLVHERQRTGRCGQDQRREGPSRFRPDRRR